MIILKTRSEVKVTVTQNGLWHSAIPRCIYKQNLEFLSQRIKEICPKLNAVSRNLVRGQVQGHSDPIMVWDTLSSQDASTHQIWDSYLK